MWRSVLCSSVKRSSSHFGSKTPFLRKEVITQNQALVFQFLPAPSSSLHPMNGESKCARFFGSPGPSHHSNGKAKCAGMEIPRSAPTQSKTPFSRKEFNTQNLALVFQFLPAPFSSLHPMNGETKCARFLGLPGPAEPENLAHLLLPSLHHSNGKATCAGMGGTPTSAPTPIKNALFTKRIYHSKSGPDFSIFARSFLLPTPNERRDSKTPFSRKEFTQNLALIFQFLPAPSSSLHPMNGETKCARFLGSPGPAEPENLAH